MFLQKQIKNRYTIGKRLRNYKGLRKRDPEAKAVELPQQLKQYKQELIKNGMKVNNLQFAMFKTKNGLNYPGLMATNQIPSNATLVSVPVECLLTTRDAFISDIQIVFEENPSFFAKKFTSDWQDHILLTFILYEYQKGKLSKWYNLIRNLPKDIDYAIFWSEQEISQMEDTYMQIGIKQQRQKFFKEVGELMQIVKKYPTFFQKETFTIDNIKWIQTHLITRCFGKYFEYTTMVPFAQLFNHECIDVYYTMGYNPGNSADTKQQMYEEHTLTEKQIEEMASSQGSYDASDVVDQNQGIQVIDVQPQKISILFQDVLSTIKSLTSYLTGLISFNDSVSLPFIISTFEFLSEIKVSDESKSNLNKKLELVYANNVKYLKLVKQFYNKLDKTTYSHGIKQKKQKISQIKPQPKQNEYYFNKQWPTDKFDDFLMICSTKDQFEKGSQVYFCYGRLPNKLLLMRYGIALQHNKYNHLFIRINIEELVYKNSFLLRVIQSQINFNKFRRFKIKRTKMNVQILTFQRGLLWKYHQSVDQIFLISNIEKQEKVLIQAQKIYSTKLSSYKKTLYQNQKLLKDPTLNYHHHFSLIYKIEQQRILNQQLKMIDYARQILRKLSKKQGSLEQILKNEKDEQKLTYQIMMENYFRYFRIN